MSLTPSQIQILKDNASLILAPSAPYGVGGFQAIKPFTEAGRFDFSRTTGKYVDKTGGLTWVPANVPAVDENGALVFEPARTNLLRYSSDMTNAVWVTVGTNPISVSPKTAPNGDLAFRLTGVPVVSTHRVFQQFAVVAGVYTFSAYIQYVDIQWVQVVFSGGSSFGLTGFTNFDLINGTVSFNNLQTASIEDAGNGWWKIEVSQTSIGTQSNAQVDIMPVPEFDFGRLFNSSQTGSIDVSLPQLEAGSYATSYIPTAGATATRTQDQPQLRNQSLSGDFWVFTEVVIPARIVGIFDVYNAAGSRVFYYAISSVGKATINSVLGGPVQTGFGPAINAGDTVKILIRKNAANGTISLFSNGQKHGVDIATTLTDINRFLWLGSFGYFMSVKMPVFALGNDILSDSDAIALTT